MRRRGGIPPGWMLAALNGSCHILTPVPPIPPWPAPVPVVIPAYPAYYCSPTGSDATGDGSIGNPWRQLSKAFSSAPAPAVVYLRGGTYTNFFATARDTLFVTNYAGETATIDRATAGNVVNIENSRNISFALNPGGGDFIIQRSGAVGASGSYTGLRFYHINSTDPFGGDYGNFVVNGLTIRTIDGYGIQVLDANNVAGIVHDVSVHNCRITDTGTAIRLAYVSTGTNRVWYNELYDNRRMIVNDAPAGNDNGAVGLALNTNASGIDVAYNAFYGNYAPSLDYGYDGGAIEIYASSGNYIHDNYAYDNEGFIETGTNGVNMAIDNEIYNNRVWGRISYDTPQDTPLLLLRTSELVYNNTFYPTDGLDVLRIQEGVGGFFGILDNLKVVNNIVVPLAANLRAYMMNKAAFTAPGIEIDYNMIWNPGGAGQIVAERTGFTYTQEDRAAWTADTGYGAHDIWNGDPLFVNPAIDDFDLLPGSPAIGAGAIVAPYTTIDHHDMGSQWP